MKTFNVTILIAILFAAFAVAFSPTSASAASHTAPVAHVQADAAPGAWAITNLGTGDTVNGHVWTIVFDNGVGCNAAYTALDNTDNPVVGGVSDWSANYFLGFFIDYSYTQYGRTLHCD